MKICNGCGDKKLIYYEDDYGICFCEDCLRIKQLYDGVLDELEKEI